MTTVAKNDIIIYNKGDTFTYPLFINLGTKINPQQYILKNTDKVYFSIVRPHEPFEAGVVRKILTWENLNSDGNIILTITPEDTERLKSGVYYYEIKLVINASDDQSSMIYDIVTRKKFIIR